MQHFKSCHAITVLIFYHYFIFETIRIHAKICRTPLGTLVSTYPSHLATALTVNRCPAPLPYALAEPGDSCRFIAKRQASSAQSRTAAHPPSEGWQRSNSKSERPFVPIWHPPHPKRSWAQTAWRRSGSAARAGTTIRISLHRLELQDVSRPRAPFGGSEPKTPRFSARAMPPPPQNQPAATQDRANRRQTAHRQNKIWQLASPEPRHHAINARLALIYRGFGQSCTNPDLRPPPTWCL